MQERRIVIISTLDTKGQETDFLRKLINSRGHHTAVVDCGLLGTPGFAPEVTRQEVAGAAGTTIECLLSHHDKGLAIRAMSEGVTALLMGMHAQRGIAGVIGLGGGQGTVLATAAMKALPFGLPKVMISTVANGATAFGPFVGIRDITILHSVADILGLNAVTRRVLAEGAGAVCGMVEQATEEVATDKPTVAMTTAGVTTAGAVRIRDLLQLKGYEVVCYHCNGVGSRAMEELADEGKLAGVLDLTPHDITDLLFGGIFSASTGRMQATCRRGVPQVVVPGATDFILFGPLDTVPKPLRSRHVVIHNSLHTHVRANREEMVAVGRFIAERLCESRGPAMVLIPRRGYTQLNVLGGPMYAPDSDRGFEEGLSQELARHPDSSISVFPLELHINDAAFAEAAASCMDMVIRRGGHSTTRR
ncbi:MAG TPA: Tm-1-like ATP-binding domain-containing protein [Spirochaetia bacterium]|nr:Tm-1-like ATP-binding domain-containing protein [Spirochaetia bacterium]